MKISLSNLLNYFSLSKQKKNPTKKWYFGHNWWGGGHFVVGTTQKYHFLFDAAP